MKKSLFISIIFSILLIGLGSAQTIITGKIYDSSNSEVAGVSVEVICDSNPLDTVTSQNDGTYAVRFSEDKCTLGNTINVNAVKGTLKGQETNKVTTCEDPQACNESEYISVLNVVIKETYIPPSSSSSSSGSSSGGGSSHYYNCGNNKCDTGETETTCPKDCVKIIADNSFANLSFSETSNADSGNAPDENANSQDSISKTQSGITGAVTGIMGNLRSIKSIIIIIFVVGIFVATFAIAITRIRKRRVF